MRNLLPVKLRNDLLRLQQVRRGRSGDSARQDLPPTMLQMRQLRQDLPDRRASHLHRQELPLHGVRKGDDNEQRGGVVAAEKRGTGLSRRTRPSRCIGSDSESVDGGAERDGGREQESGAGLQSFGQRKVCRMFGRTQRRPSADGPR